MTPRCFHLFRFLKSAGKRESQKALWLAAVQTVANLNFLQNGATFCDSFSVAYSCTAGLQNLLIVSSPLPFLYPYFLLPLNLIPRLDILSASLFVCFPNRISIIDVRNRSSRSSFTQKNQNPILPHHPPRISSAIHKIVPRPRDASLSLSPFRSFRIVYAVKRIAKMFEAAYSCHLHFWFSFVAGADEIFLGSFGKVGFS